MGKKKVCRVTKEEFEKDYSKYFDIAKKEIVEVTDKGKVIWAFDKESAKRFAALKAIWDMYPNGLKIDPSDIR